MYLLNLLDQKFQMFLIECGPYFPCETNYKRVKLYFEQFFIEIHFIYVVDTEAGKKLKNTIEDFLGAFIEDSDWHIQEKKNRILYRMYI